MQEVIVESLGYTFLSIVFTAVISPFVIALLFKTNQISNHVKSKVGGGMEGDNSTFLNAIGADSKNGTPNIGGVIVWIAVPFLSFILLDLTPLITGILIGFILTGFWGLLDVVANNKFKSTERFRVAQERFIVRLLRFFLPIPITFFAIYFLFNNGLLDSFTIDLFFTTITVSVNLLALIVLSIIGHFAIYSGELTDGADGLMIGIFGIIYASLGLLLIVEQQYELLPLIGIILGTIIVDLYFNIPPARFFNGGPAAMPLSLTAFLIGLLSDNLIPYLIISAMTWIIMFSSMIQILSMKFFNRRVFKIAPLHHHFQALGWPEHKVVMRFWLYTATCAILGIFIALS